MKMRMNMKMKMIFMFACMHCCMVNVEVMVLKALSYLFGNDETSLESMAHGPQNSSSTV